MDVEVQGGDEVRRIAARLRHAANSRETQNAINRGLRRVAKPLIQDIKTEARATLPRSGGLAAYIAKASFTAVASSGTVKISAVRTKATGEVDLKLIDRGRVRHPVFGSRKWVLQNVRPGFISRPVEDAGPAAQIAMLKVLEDIENQIT